jgi:hypothetical protein
MAIEGIPSGTTSNSRVNPTVRPVTGLAGARPVTVRPAGYALH